MSGPDVDALVADVRDALPSVEGHEPNCPCSVGRSHAALDELVALARDAVVARHRKGIADARAEAAEAERDLLAEALRRLADMRPEDEESPFARHAIRETSGIARAALDELAVLATPDTPPDA